MSARTRDLVGVGELEEAAALLHRETDWGSGLMTTGRPDPLQLAHRVLGDHLVEDGLLHHAGDDGSDHSARVGGVGGLVLDCAVSVLDRLASLFKLGEEDVEADDGALDEA